ncbi:MD-2-related lipid-recognition protein-like [Ceratina calcarata]|uniref:MD-2-related lipid-recognition protein-like n=1 Tax=Ceratina calcarata TaxID=156304 RepID=A0AAJ7JIH9_9HYME|nr:MD-2-related lipid-recognition protein-like [Ceratina calcarata]
MTRDNVTLLSFISCLLFFGLYNVEGELIQWRPCPYPNAATASNCTIHEVYVDPCEDAASGKPCNFKRGISANMTFHYTPSFSSESIQGGIYWTIDSIDIPILSVRSNPCSLTTCPLEAGQKNIYHLETTVRRYPLREYDLKWRIWNDQQEECCFIYQITITR